ncbi:MAG TPA: Mur ligase family protein [Candidatus Saccharimonadia bacterium]|jgi:UDP-N-acetylmuramyl pentapeptide synthase
MKASFRRLLARLFERQARRLIQRHQLKVVAVAGSVGKTSTRAAIAEVLRAQYQVQNIPNPGYNSELGLPLSVFEMSVPRLLINPFAWAWRLLRTELMVTGSYPNQVLVLELGTEEPGEIARYLRYLKPDVGVLTAITPEHMQNFPDGLDQVAAEEFTLVQGSKVMVVNADAIDSKYRHKYLKDYVRVLTYSLRDQKHLPETPYILGHMRSALLAADLVAHELKVPETKIHHVLEHIKPVAGRMNPLEGVNGSRLIDDTYNSSPDAVLAALETLAKLAAEGRRIAVLGSMNELGPESPEYHRQVGAAAAGVDLLVTIGADANRYLGPAAVEAGLDPSRWKPADSPYAAGDFLRLMLAPGDLVLIKGSQNGVFAEEATKKLLANSADAAKLVRQSPSWLRTKAKQFPDAY